MTATTEEAKPPKKPRKAKTPDPTFERESYDGAPATSRYRPPPESLEIALARLVPFKLNPRGRVRQDDPTVLELAESIREFGQLVEMVVRPRGDRWEVLGGERRLVALQILGASSARCSVRRDADDDAKALDIAIQDNAQREAVHPLDEADSIVAKMRREHLTPDACAARLKKSVSHVYKLARLADLSTEGRAAFRAGLLTTQAAAALARVSPESQKAALVEAQRYADSQPEGEPIPTNRVIRALEQQTRALRDAKFPLDVVPPQAVNAVACATCPKRSSAQTALFADVLADTTDRCTDSACWDRKNAWWFEELAARRKAEGAKVAKKLAVKATHYSGKVWDGAALLAADVVPADEPAKKNGWERIKSKGRELTWSEAHEKAFGTPIPATEITVTIDGDGNPREVVSTSVTKRISKVFEKSKASDSKDDEARISKVFEKSKASDSKDDEAEKRRREKERKEQAKLKLDRATMRAAHAAALERAKLLEWPDSHPSSAGVLMVPAAEVAVLLRIAAFLAVDKLVGSKALDDLECPPITAYWEPQEKHAARAEHVEDRSPTELARLVTVALLERTMHRDDSKNGACRARALELLGVDVAALRAELEAAKKPRKAKPTKKGAKKA
jgi:ParB family chromosome partitioning protein